MMSAKSRRVYITLNPDKEKDRIIEAYLSQSYSEADAIKEAIYRLATNNIQTVQNDINSTEKVQLANKDMKILSTEKVQKGNESNNKVENISSELEMNELDELSKFL